MTDQRIVYGARCMWWDSIDKVAVKGGVPGGLPVCPHCGRSLFETTDEATWWSGVSKYEADGHPGYRVMIEWSRGKCFPDRLALEAAYRAAMRTELNAAHMGPLLSDEEVRAALDGLSGLAGDFLKLTAHLIRDHGVPLASFEMTARTGEPVTAADSTLPPALAGYHAGLHHPAVRTGHKHSPRDLQWPGRVEVGASNPEPAGS